MRPGGGIGRRTFLRAMGMSAGLMTLSKLGPGVFATARAEVSVPELRVLTAADAGTLSAIADRMVFTGDPEMPRFADTGGLRIIDAVLLYVQGDVRQQLHWALLLFEYAPPLFAGRLSTFTGLDAAAQDAYIAGWAESRFTLRRVAFQALKNLSYLGYYSDDATWKGIRYDGPWVPRPRKVMGLGVGG
jgi:hypothetical protein